MSDHHFFPMEPHTTVWMVLPTAGDFLARVPPQPRDVAGGGLGLRALLRQRLGARLLLGVRLGLVVPLEVALVRLAGVAPRPPWGGNGLAGAEGPQSLRDASEEGNESPGRGRPALSMVCSVCLRGGG